MRKNVKPTQPSPAALFAECSVPPRNSFGTRRRKSRTLLIGKHRSEATRERAVRVGLYEARTLAELSKQWAVIVSVCPPHAAEAFAEEVLGTGFHGLYVDANAIA